MITSAEQGKDVNEVLSKYKSQPRLLDRVVTPNNLKAYCFPSGSIYLKTELGDSLLHENARRQFLSKIAYPDHKAFNERISNSSRGKLIDELLDYRSSSGKAVFEKNLLLRTNPVTGEIVAFLSERYNPYDNHQVAEAVGNGLHSLSGEFARQTCVIDQPESYSMRMVVGFPDVPVTVPDGHGVWLGLDISNDETGNGSVRIIPAVFRWVCSNGMVSCQKVMELRHYHTKQNMGIETAIIQVCNKLPDFREKWQRQADAGIKYETPRFDDAAKLQDYLGKTDVSRADAREILRVWAKRAGIEEVYQWNLYQLAQAVSFYAASKGKNRQQLERLAHHIITRDR